MTKKKEKKTTRQELQMAITSQPENSSAEFTFGNLDNFYCPGDTVLVNYTSKGIGGISFMSEGFAGKHYSVLGDKDIADLLDVMRKIVAIADALEVLK